MSKRANDPDFSPIRLLVLDFDGVMTDGRVLVLEDGREAVFCHRGDGLGLTMLRERGFPVFVLSKERNPVVSARCKKLGLPVQQSCDHKLPALEELARERGLGAREIAYVGNDVNDLECLQWCGLGIAVADAEPAALAASDWVTPRNGGFGAVRDVCDRLLEIPPAAS